jgi:hypothetical protein
MFFIGEVARPRAPGSCSVYISDSAQFEDRTPRVRFVRETGAIWATFREYFIEKFKRKMLRLNAYELSQPQHTRRLRCAAFREFHSARSRTSCRVFLASETREERPRLFRLFKGAGASSPSYQYWERGESLLPGQTIADALIWEREGRAMTIENQKAELEALILERMQLGAFVPIEDALLQALQSAPLPSGQSAAESNQGPELAGADLVARMQASPYKEIVLEPARDCMPVRDVAF